MNEQDRARSDRLTMTDGSLEDVRQEHASVGWADSDSITQQLFFLLDTFKGVDIELAEVERVVEDKEFLVSLGNRRTLELARGTQEDAAKRERALYRLMLLGVVEDYLVESKFVVHLANVSSAEVARCLSDFVQRTDPGAQRHSVVEFVAQADNMTLREAVSTAAGEPIRFTYDVIVESRRRSLREMYVAARDAPPGGLRERVLDYLTRGDISPVLEGLVESTEFDYAVWEQEPPTMPDPRRRCGRGPKGTWRRCPCCGIPCTPCPRRPSGRCCSPPAPWTRWPLPSRPGGQGCGPARRSPTPSGLPGVRGHGR